MITREDSKTAELDASMKVPMKDGKYFYKKQ